MPNHRNAKMSPPPPDFATTGVYAMRADGPAPTRFQVVGERSSGTNYVKRLFGRNTQLTPVEALGWKHGGPQALAIPADLLVIVVVRNATDWALSMHAKPWHAAPQLQALPFSDFIRAPWDSVIDRPRYFGAGAEHVVGQPLQADRDPMTGAPYPNLFALRRGKLIGHLSYLSRACSVALVRMEEAQARPDGVLDTVLTALALPARTGDLRPVVKRLGAKFKPAIDARPATPTALAPDDLAFLRAETQPALEAALGYEYGSDPA